MPKSLWKFKKTPRLWIYKAVLDFETKHDRPPYMVEVADEYHYNKVGFCDKASNPHFLHFLAPKFYMCLHI